MVDENTSKNLDLDKKNKIREKIRELETVKKGLIERVKKLSKELKMKEIEYKAVEKLLENDLSEEAMKISRRIRDLEFRISTQAISPQAEKKYVKKIIALEKKLERLKPYLNAKKRKKYLDGVILKLKDEVNEVEGKLKEIRGELKELYGELKLMRTANKKGVNYGKEKEDDLLTLSDIAEIEEKS